MSKLIDCPICGEKDKPVRNDAKVCSTKCRVAKWRKTNKQNELIVTKIDELESK